MTANKLNDFIKQSNESVKYAGVDEAGEELIDAYIQANATSIGTEVGENLGGFVSLTQQTDYPDENIVMGDSISMFSDESIIPNIAGDPTLRTVPELSLVYVLGPPGQVGNVPSFVPNPEELPVKDLASIITSLTGIETEPSNPSRNVASGSMQSVSDVLTGMDKTFGPWDEGLTEFLDFVQGDFLDGFKPGLNVDILLSMFPVDQMVQISVGDIVGIQDLCSPVLS